MDSIISATVNEFSRISGIGRSRIYELIAAGELDSIKIGKRRLVLVNSYRRLIEAQRAAPAKAAAGTVTPSEIRS
jgi:excisionase family DNA binding protein